jgi:hypothetical protein
MGTKITSLILLSMMVGGIALGAEKTKSSPKAKTPEVTAEQRANMAAVHEKMAVCLRSDKPIGDCRKEMMQSCTEMMGKDGCPMMGQMGRMHDMMDKGMMDQSGSKSGGTQPEDTKKQEK